MASRTAALLCAAALALGACRGAKPTQKHPAAVDRVWPAAKLRSGGGPVEASLAVEEAHRYRLRLQKGTLIRLVVDQEGIDAEVSLTDPAGALVLKADRFINDRGPELVLAVAAADGLYTLSVRGLKNGPGRYAAHIEALRPASAADRRCAEAYRLFTSAEAEGLAPEEAMARWSRALATWRELGETALEAEALERIARHYYDRHEYRQAAPLFRQAADAFKRAGDRRWEAIARKELGANLIPLSEPQEAAEQYARALPLARQEGDRFVEAQILQGLGQAYQHQGELQPALDHYRAAFALLPKWPYTLHALGVLYARYLGDPEQGRELLLQARDAWPPGVEWKERTLSQLGRLAEEQGRLDEARSDFEEALSLRHNSDPCGDAILLAGLARVEEGQGRRPAADARMGEALRIVGSQSCPRSAPLVTVLDAGLAERRRDGAAALAGFRRAAKLYAMQGDRMGLAESLAGAARSERALGDQREALAASRQALDILEGVRPTLLSDDLRASFFSGARQAFDLQIALLLDQGDAEAAWVTAEQAKARVLGDLLAEAGAGLRRGASSSLLAQERDLQRQLNILERRRFTASDAAADTLLPLRRSIDALVEKLELLRGEIRRRDPRYASLVQPEPVSRAAVQRELLDGDTVLLEYRLGESASTLWIVTRDALTAARLPPRREIEQRTQEAAQWMQGLSSSGQSPPALCALSRTVLGPAAPFLGKRRLVVVPDGALASLSFAALPDPTDPRPCSSARPLVENHEIAYLPSAATLLLQRRLAAGRRPAPGWLAVVADPVYGAKDGRLPAARAADVAADLGRLPGTSEEARAITAMVPAGKAYVASGFAASRQTVASGALQGFRILHFAAHGLLDTRHPLLSALVLSQRDPAGRPVDGILPAHEIYDLDLPAELVVLSACETALGREVPGEGLISGLPRAFLYAGASRVLVSLWAVEDRSTRDLMVLFYQGLFQRGLAPAQALQEAQRAMAHAGRRPSQWAGFVLLGDWQPLPPF
jgi:CHAT domain-containing protein/Tfp pilus assembly protein PilF